jgi:hypothetical protein
MLATTIQIIKSGLKGDPTISPRDRVKILAALRNGPDAGTPNLGDSSKPTAQRIVRRGEAAQMYSCSLRLIDKLAEQGVLRKVRLPGRQRGAGFLEADLLALISGKEAA